MINILKIEAVYWRESFLITIELLVKLKFYCFHKLIFIYYNRRGHPVFKANFEKKARINSFYLLFFINNLEYAKRLCTFAPRFRREEEVVIGDGIKMAGNIGILVID
jgi:hypothetical protein